MLLRPIPQCQLNHNAPGNPPLAKGSFIYNGLSMDPYDMLGSCSLILLLLPPCSNLPSTSNLACGRFLQNNPLPVHLYHCQQDGLSLQPPTMPGVCPPFNGRDQTLPPTIQNGSTTDYKSSMPYACLNTPGTNN